MSTTQKEGQSQGEQSNNNSLHKYSEENPNQTQQGQKPIEFDVTSIAVFCGDKKNSNKSSGNSKGKSRIIGNIIKQKRGTQNQTDSQEELEEESSKLDSNSMTTNSQKNRSQNFSNYSNDSHIGSGSSSVNQSSLNQKQELYKQEQQLHQLFETMDISKPSNKNVNLAKNGPSGEEISQSMILKRNKSQADTTNFQNSFLNSRQSTGRIPRSNNAPVRVFDQSFSQSHNNRTRRVNPNNLSMIEFGNKYNDFDIDQNNVSKNNVILEEPCEQEDNEQDLAKQKSYQQARQAKKQQFNSISIPDQNYINNRKSDYEPDDLMGIFKAQNFLTNMNNNIHHNKSNSFLNNNIQIPHYNKYNNQNNQMNNSFSHQQQQYNQYQQQQQQQQQILSQQQNIINQQFKQNNSNEINLPFNFQDSQRQQQQQMYPRFQDQQQNQFNMQPNSQQYTSSDTITNSYNTPRGENLLSEQKTSHNSSVQKNSTPSNHNIIKTSPDMSNTSSTQKFQPNLLYLQGRNLSIISTDSTHDSDNFTTTKSTSSLGNSGKVDLHKNQLNNQYYTKNNLVYNQKQFQTQQQQQMKQQVQGNQLLYQQQQNYNNSHIQNNQNWEYQQHQQQDINGLNNMMQQQQQQQQLNMQMQVQNDPNGFDNGFIQSQQQQQQQQQYNNHFRQKSTHLIQNNAPQHHSSSSISQMDMLNIQYNQQNNINLFNFEDQNQQQSNSMNFDLSQSFQMNSNSRQNTQVSDSTSDVVSVSSQNTTNRPRGGGRKNQPLPHEDSKLFDINVDKLSENKYTTIMIKNIPNKYSSEMLQQTINKNFKGLYDFFYLPIDQTNKCNVGYAFINFESPESIRAFYEEFNNMSWKKFNSDKVCEIKYARIQGRQNLTNHFKFSSVMNQKDKKCKPLFISQKIQKIVQQQKQSCKDINNNIKK